MSLDTLSVKLLQKSISGANCGIAHLDGIRLFNYLETQSRKSNIIPELWQVFALLSFFFFVFSLIFYHFFYQNYLKPQSQKSNIFFAFFVFHSLPFLSLSFYHFLIKISCKPNLGRATLFSTLEVFALLNLFQPKFKQNWGHR